MNFDDELKELIANALECEKDSILSESGLGKHYKWDSLGHVAIMVALEEKYGIEVDESNINNLLTFVSIEDFIFKYVNK